MKKVMLLLAATMLAAPVLEASTQLLDKDPSTSPATVSQGKKTLNARRTAWLFNPPSWTMPLSQSQSDPQFRDSSKTSISSPAHTSIEQTEDKAMSATDASVLEASTLPSSTIPGQTRKGLRTSKRSMAPISPSPSWTMPLSQSQSDPQFRDSSKTSISSPAQTSIEQTEGKAIGAEDALKLSSSLLKVRLEINETKVDEKSATLEKWQEIIKKLTDIEEKMNLFSDFDENVSEMDKVCIQIAKNGSIQDGSIQAYKKEAAEKAYDLWRREAQTAIASASGFNPATGKSIPGDLDMAKTNYRDLHEHAAPSLVGTELQYEISQTIETVEQRIEEIRRQIEEHAARVETLQNSVATWTQDAQSLFANTSPDTLDLATLRQRLSQINGSLSRLDELKKQQVSNEVGFDEANDVESQLEQERNQLTLQITREKQRLAEEQERQTKELVYQKLKGEVEKAALQNVDKLWDFGDRISSRESQIEELKAELQKHKDEHATDVKNINSLLDLQIQLLVNRRGKYVFKANKNDIRSALAQFGYESLEAYLGASDEERKGRLKKISESLRIKTTEIGESTGTSSSESEPDTPQTPRGDSSGTTPDGTEGEGEGEGSKTETASQDSLTGDLDSTRQEAEKATEPDSRMGKSEAGGDEQASISTAQSKESEEAGDQSDADDAQGANEESEARVVVPDWVKSDPIGNRENRKALLEKIDQAKISKDEKQAAYKTYLERLKSARTQSTKKKQKGSIQTMINTVEGKIRNGK